MRIQQIEKQRNSSNQAVKLIIKFILLRINNIWSHTHSRTYSVQFIGDEGSLTTQTNNHPPSKIYRATIPLVVLNRRETYLKFRVFESKVLGTIYKMNKTGNGNRDIMTNYKFYGAIDKLRILITRKAQVREIYDYNRRRETSFQDLNEATIWKKVDEQTETQRVNNINQYIRNIGFQET